MRTSAPLRVGLDFALSARSFHPRHREGGGEHKGSTAVRASSLARLVAATARDVDVTIEANNVGAVIRCGRSNYGWRSSPSMTSRQRLKIDGELGRAELSKVDALQLFGTPAFCVCRDGVRYYLNGINLHDHEGDIAAVGTNTHTLCRKTVPNAQISTDRRLIVPRFSCALIVKLLKKQKCESDTVVLRRS